jgi:ABC-type multidrug transport system fused ATPase/permease subunit
MVEPQFTIADGIDVMWEGLIRKAGSHDSLVAVGGLLFLRVKGYL